eukprot:1156201-Pelagomonas_calceolata.AAC.10
MTGVDSSTFRALELFGSCIPKSLVAACHLKVAWKRLGPFPFMMHHNWNVLRAGRRWGTQRGSREWAALVHHEKLAPV